MDTKTIQLLTVDDYCRFFSLSTQHPLVSVARFEDYGTYPAGQMELGFYTIMLKDVHCGELSYGRSKYDYQAGTMLFTSPGQVIGHNGRTPDMPTARGRILMFHPDLLYGTPLARLMKNYTFFSYASNEALHMSDREREVINTCFDEISAELNNNIDRHTKHIVSAYLLSLLNHCSRFYERQFITREVSNHSLLARLDAVLDNYFDSGQQASEGIPSVQYCAGEVCLSPNYFGDLIKRETGRTAIDYIRQSVIAHAKIILAEGEMNVSETAYRLGFRYPHHLTRMFKSVTGQTPNEFIASQN